jgi:hypothetical protein
MNVGTGITRHLPQDSYGYVVVSVSASGKSAKVVQMPTPMELGHEVSRYDGPFPVWSHTYTQDELDAQVLAARPMGAVRNISLRKDGSWRFAGEYGTGTALNVERATYYRNHSY